MRKIKPESLIVPLALLSLVAIAVIILCRTQGILYDESYFVPNIPRIAQLGLTNEFLLKITGSPGPTYAVIHSFFSGITHFSTLGIRLVNFGLLLLLLAFIYLNAKLMGAASPLSVAANFIFIPMVWVVCGLALTEVPTMLCAMVSLYFMLQCFKNGKPIGKQMLLAVAAGLFLSFAIMGRSFFLMVVFAALACLFIYAIIVKPKTGVTGNSAYSTPGFNNKWAVVLLGVFLLAALPLPAYVFKVWGALAPPTENVVVGADNISIVPWYALLSFCYCGFVALILAPAWFVADKRTLLATLAVSLVFLVANLINGYFEFAPMMSAAAKLLGPAMFGVYQRAIPALVVFLSFHFLLSSAIRLWQNRNNPVFVFIGLTALFIAFSAIKVKVQFSSRYVAQVVPYFLLLFIPYQKNDWTKIVRISIGAALGFVSLWFYYNG
ncbi:hypothetical protein [Mucilaginibacter pedocola]|uniref:Glycosyltransferase RgtA/B/C/D-like domain-containing protein n=1 Tax=Mucilaginibacter pedocola TaxID=1792845 RepID=A0A1S9PC35_9SPHI|nr:hypothetical protein [Mucilaginibacter pedocola]OOQ58499.1 hypothetical protein BC343_07470 [Mucilaginibacter pedocola]